MSKVDYAAIAAKDLLTEDEAAAYCSVAKSTFCEHRGFGVRARNVMGRKLYPKADLLQAMMKAALWRRSTGDQAEQSTNQAQLHTSTGEKTSANGGVHLARLSPTPLRKYVPRKPRS